MMLLPYTDVDGIATFPDSQIKKLYQRMEEEGTVDMVFYDGLCRSEEEFLKIMKFGKNSLYLIALEDGISGCVWLNSFEVKSAHFHFCFFNNLRGKRALEVGYRSVCQLLYMDVNGIPVFDVLVGIVPVANVPANRWCRMLKFPVLGTLPSGIYNAGNERSEPAKIYYVERGKYGERQ